LVGRLSRGCAVHWARSYQWVAARISSNVPSSQKPLAHQGFEIIAQEIPSSKSADEVQKCLRIERGKTSVNHYIDGAKTN